MYVVYISAVFVRFPCAFTTSPSSPILSQQHHMTNTPQVNVSGSPSKINCMLTHYLRACVPCSKTKKNSKPLWSPLPFLEDEELVVTPVLFLISAIHLSTVTAATAFTSNIEKYTRKLMSVQCVEDCVTTIRSRRSIDQVSQGVTIQCFVEC